MSYQLSSSPAECADNGIAAAEPDLASRSCHVLSASAGQDVRQRSSAQLSTLLTSLVKILQGLSIHGKPAAILFLSIDIIRTIVIIKTHFVASQRSRHPRWEGKYGGGAVCKPRRTQKLF